VFPLLLLAAQLATVPGEPSASPSDVRPRPATERTYERLKPSLFTIEVHSGNDGSKSALGSGYLVSAEGHILTNYHVVGSYIEEPDRYSLRARNVSGVRPVVLVRFDLVNDLALLKAEGVDAQPLKLAQRPAAPGSPIIAFGNPEGLGLSLIEGIFNGFAEKGLVDRMLLSMPLNSGMSGGPILDARGEVIGTNVAVMWLSNSLSFGVPVSEAAPLLSGAALRTDKKSLLAEVSRQLDALEAETAKRLLAEIAAVPADARVDIGGINSRRPPKVFECWDSTHEWKDEGVTKVQYACNLQFTPSIERLGEVASVEVLIEHFASRKSRYGFFGTLDSHAQSHSQVEPVDPGNSIVSPPRCVADRVRVGAAVWKLSTCTSAYVQHAGLGRYDLIATSLSQPDRAAFLSLKMTGFRTDTFLALARHFLEGIGGTAP
jgi:serine protease Do